MAFLENDRSRLVGRREVEWSLNDRLAIPAADLLFLCFEKLSPYFDFELNMLMSLLNTVG